jgi:hypothetical protein
MNPSWLPPLILMADHDHLWANYVEAIYARFRRDFILSQPTHLGRQVGCRKKPPWGGKESGFWHCISDGKIEDDRLPDIRRCERIGWLRPIIENVSDPQIDTWENFRGSERNLLFWFREEFLVVVGHRIGREGGTPYLLLLTAYLTQEESRKRKLRAERDAWRKKMTPPASGASGVATPSTPGG